MWKTYFAIENVGEGKEP